MLNPERPAGMSLTQEHLGEVELTAVSRDGRLEVQGRLLNASPLRPMAFYVTVETEVGTYAEWFIPNVEVNKSTPLPGQVVTKRKVAKRSSGRSVASRL